MGEERVRENVWGRAGQPFYYGGVIAQAGTPVAGGKLGRNAPAAVAGAGGRAAGGTGVEALPGGGCALLLVRCLLGETTEGITRAQGKWLHPGGAGRPRRQQEATVAAADTHAQARAKGELAQVREGGDYARPGRLCVRARPSGWSDHSCPVPPSPASSSPIARQLLLLFLPQGNRQLLILYGTVQVQGRRKTPHGSTVLRPCTAGASGVSALCTCRSATPLLPTFALVAPHRWPPAPIGPSSVSALFVSPTLTLGPLPPSLPIHQGSPSALPVNQAVRTPLQRALRQYLHPPAPSSQTARLHKGGQWQAGSGPLALTGSRPSCSPRRRGTAATQR